MASLSFLFSGLGGNGLEGVQRCFSTHEGVESPVLRGAERQRVAEGREAYPGTV